MKKLFALILAALPFMVSAQSTIRPFQGGTGIQNNNASTLTWSGNFATTFTRTGITSVTFPTSGTLATTADIPALPITPQNGGTGVSNNSANTLTWSGNFAFTGTLTNTTAVTFPTSGTLCGSVTACTVTGLTNSALTAGRITTAGTAGVLQDFSTLLFDSGTVRLTVGSGSGASNGWTLGNTASGVAKIWNNALASGSGNDYALFQNASGDTALNAAAGRTLDLNVGSGAKMSFAATAGLGPAITAGTATTDVNALSLTQTWNNAGINFTGLKSNTTLTAAGASSLLFDFQMGGVSKVKALGDAATPFLTVNGTSQPYISLEIGGSRKGYVTALSSDIYVAADSGDIHFLTSAEQVRVVHTASANRYITMTGSNGGNPTISTSAGNLSFGASPTLTTASGHLALTSTGGEVQISSVNLRVGGSIINPTNITGQSGYHEMVEMTAPSAPAANTARIYAVDNGGKTQLCAIFNSGVPQCFATEP